MVRKSRDSARHNNLVGLNGETCYVLLTDHFSGRIFGRAFATKAPPVDWINSWLASNAPQFAWVVEENSGNAATFTEPSLTSGTPSSSPDRIRHTRMDQQNAPTKQLAMPFEPCCLARTCSPTSGRTRSTITSDSTMSSLTVIAHRVHTRCVAPRSLT
jgi:hypothetical protein